VQLCCVRCKLPLAYKATEKADNFFVIAGTYLPQTNHNLNKHNGHVSLRAGVHPSQLAPTASANCQFRLCANTTVNTLRDP